MNRNVEAWGAKRDLEPTGEGRNCRSDASGAPHAVGNAAVSDHSVRQRVVYL